MTTTTTKLPTWFWVVSGIALVWNLMGVMAFIGNATISAEALATLPEAQQNLIKTTPMWAMIAFAVATFGGAIGSIGLLLRKSWAKMAFIVSLIGIGVQLLHGLVLSDALEVYGGAGLIMPILTTSIGAFLIWFAGDAEKRGWLN